MRIGGWEGFCRGDSVEQRGHELGGKGRAAGAACELRATLRFEGLSVDQPTQPHEFMTLVDEADQFQPE